MNKKLYNAPEVREINYRISEVVMLGASDGNGNPLIEDGGGTGAGGVAASQLFHKTPHPPLTGPLPGVSTGHPRLRRPLKEKALLIQLTAQEVAAKYR